jgi:uncharacterized membrane protein YbhN (UPF0104 family)
MILNASKTPRMNRKWIKISGLCIASALLLCIGLWLSGLEKALEAFGRFPGWTITAVLATFALNLVVVSFRLERLLIHLGIPLSFPIAFKTCLQGQIGALFLVSLFGQIMGRHLALRQHGVPSATVAMLTVIERFAMLFVCSGLCLTGALWLLDASRISAFLGQTSFPLILATAFFAMLTSLWAGKSKFEARIFTQISRWRNIGNFLEINAITLLSQFLVLGAFVLAGKGLAPEAEWMDLFAAAAIISFAASMPISVGGWGVRELTAIFAFGQIGIPASSALAASILVGLASTVVILAAWPFIYGKGSIQKDSGKPINDMGIFCPSPAETSKRIPTEKISAWFLSMATAILIFFQFHISLFNGEINLNTADPFAIIALAVIVAHAINERRLPAWRIPRFNTMLLAISLLLLFGFIWGIRLIGVTQWALAGRLVGWLVLLGYVSIGVLTISWLGHRGMRRFIETFLITAAIVVISCALVRWTISMGWLDIEFPYNFEGYAGNRNAFAFQMLMCSAIFLAYSARQRNVLERLRTMNPALASFYHKRYILFTFSHGVILAGLLFSGSRAGIGTGILLLLASVMFTGLVCHKMLLKSLVCAFIIFVIFSWILSLPLALTSESPASNREHLESIRHGLETWKKHPFLGAGLGVAFEESALWHGSSLVIHSTPVWILADFGLLGTLVLDTVYIGMFFYSYRHISDAASYGSIVMLLGIFAIFGLVHEIFYQRIFWLVIGACIALPFHRQIPNKKSFI